MSVLKCLAVGLSALVLGHANPALAAAPTVDAQYATLAHTINFDQAIYAHVPAWGDALEDDQYALVKGVGFTAVRLPIDWIAHMGKAAPYVIEPQYFARVDHAVAMATAAGLSIILDNHVDKELCADPPAHHARFLALQTQIAEHYRQAAPTVMLEVLAEPYDKLLPLWNAYFAEGLAIIRRSNPTRTVLVGPAYYNNVKHLAALELPADPQLIVCVHQYRPIPFTFQGADYIPGFDGKKYLGTPWPGTPAQKLAIAQDYDMALAWGKAHQRPIFIEEFGATNDADEASRVRWTLYNREMIEQRGMSWGYWAFWPTYSLYNMTLHAWKTDLLKALLPNAPVTSTASLVGPN